LWQGNQLVPLPPKPFAVLAYLVARAGEVVTKDELLEAVWPETVVSEGVLKTCMGQVRQVLGETARTPRYIATVHRRGYRFIAPVTVLDPLAAAPESGAEPSPSPVGGLPQGPKVAPASPTRMVAREVELAQLHALWTQALQGIRQVVFVTGEAGIGKTTLVDAFVAQVVATEAVWLGRGLCIEQYGAGEAYLPLLAALGQLGRGLEGARLVELLRQQAPSWLLQMPALLPATEYTALHQRSTGTTRERMLRELAEAVETLGRARPLLLVLEDLHWSDYATMDWLALVARRRVDTRLLVLGTYRPADAIARVHPVRSLTQELQRHGQCTELLLPYLPEAGVATYLAQRFDAAPFPAGMAHILHQRTSGNAFFLVTVVEELVRQGLLAPQGRGWTLRGDLDAVTACVPDSIRQLIEHQLAQTTPPAQEILAAASVAGTEFVAATVATSLGQATADVEACCDTLARHGQFLQARGSTEWPDGTVAARYRFIHDLYREVLYERVPVSRRVQWHQGIGARLETGYGGAARELAAELAMHFERGRDVARAVQYRQYAGEQALRRSVPQEAIAHFTHALTLLPILPETPERTAQELQVHMALGPALMAARGWAAPEVEQTYARARTLCLQLGEASQLFPTLWGLWRFYQSRGVLPTARDLGEQLMRLAECTADPTHLLEAHGALGQTLFQLGEYAAAWEHLQQSIALIDSMAQRALVLRHGDAPGVVCLSFAALTLWCLGYPAQAMQRSQEALALAQALNYPFSLAAAQHYAAFLHHHRHEALAVQTLAEALLTLATAQGFPLYMGYGTYWRGWACAMQGEGEAGLLQMRQGLAAVLTTGQTLARPFCLVLLAEVAVHVGQIEEGLRLLTEALAAFEKSGRGDLLPEAYRLQGEFLLRQAAPDTVQAEACFLKALEVARRQHAKSWELRAAMSLSRLWQQQGKQDKARELLAPVYGWFTEGFDTVDLQEAKGLLEELS
jgi:predicted ATPase/DNA-binding winged helix-turn-helix (wHTH) protein